MSEKLPTIVVNLFAGPGTGKSTTAAGIFFELKSRGYNVEQIQEYAKDQVWGDTKATLKNQVYVFAKQYHRQYRVNGKVDVMVTDSPIPTSLFYTPKDYFEAFPDLALEVFHSFFNLNYFLERVKQYNPAGRYQTEAEAKEIDKHIHNLLHTYDITHRHLPGTKETAGVIANQVEDIITGRAAEVPLFVQPVLPFPLVIEAVEGRHVGKD